MFDKLFDKKENTLEQPTISVDENQQLFKKGKGRPKGSQNKKKEANQPSETNKDIQEIDLFVKNLIQENQKLNEELTTFKNNLKEYVNNLNNIRTGNNKFRIPYTQISIGGKNGAIDELMKLFPHLK